MRTVSLADAPGVRGADALRAALLRRFAGPLRPFVRSRRLRVHAGAALLLATSLATATVAPLYSLFLLPLVLGIPHLAADVRYLGPAFPAWRAVSAGAAALLVGGVAATGLLDAPLAGALSIVCVGAFVRGRAWARLAVVGAGALLAWVAWAEPQALRLALAHLHHAIALVVWWVLRPRARSEAWFPLAAAALAAATLLGALDTPILAAAARLPELGPGWGGVEAWLSPPAASDVAWRFVVLYAFGQSLHYGVWLRLVPDDARATATPRSFRRSLQALEHDLGRGVVLGFAAASVALLAAALVAWQTAWAAYMRLAVFHAWLELVALALLLVVPRTAGATAPFAASPATRSPAPPARTGSHV